MSIRASVRIGSHVHARAAPQIALAFSYLFANAASVRRAEEARALMEREEGLVGAKAEMEAQLQETIADYERRLAAAVQDKELSLERLRIELYASALASPCLHTTSPCVPRHVRLSQATLRMAPNGCEWQAGLCGRARGAASGQREGGADRVAPPAGDEAHHELGVVKRMAGMV